MRSLNAGEEEDISSTVEWAVDDSNKLSVGNDGEFLALSGGGATVNATDSSTLAKAEAYVQVIACKDNDQGARQTEVKIGGENCVGNSIDSGGADKNDFHVNLTGDFIVDGFQIFARRDQKVTVSYSLGSPGSTTQSVNMKIVNCNKEDVDSLAVSQGSGTTTFNATKGDRFNIVTTITGGCYGKRPVYDLIKDGGSAFRYN